LVFNIQFRKNLEIALSSEQLAWVKQLVIAVTCCHCLLSSILLIVCFTLFMFTFQPLSLSLSLSYCLTVLLLLFAFVFALLLSLLMLHTLLAHLWWTELLIVVMSLQSSNYFITFWQEENVNNVLGDNENVSIGLTVFPFIFECMTWRMLNEVAIIW